MKKTLGIITAGVLILNSIFLAPKESRAVTTNIGFPQGEMYENGGYDPSAAAPVFGNWSYNSPFSGTETNVLKWEKDITDMISYFSPTVIDKDGNIYYTTGDEEVVSIDKHGVQRWKVKLDTSASQNVAPAIGYDGTIYVAGGLSIFALNPDGTVKWKSTPTVGTFYSSPAIGSDGTLYVQDAKEYKLYAFNGNDGSVKWISAAAPKAWDRNTSPVIDSEGTIYVRNDAFINAYNKSGTLKWSYQTATASNLILLKDGKIAVSNYNPGSPGTVKIIDRSGNLVKSFVTANSGGRFIVQNLFNDQLIVDDGYNITSFNEDGTKNWSYNTSGSTQHQPVIDKNGVIYFGSDVGKMYALKPDGTVKWQLNLLQHYGGSVFRFFNGGISMDKNGTLITAGELFKNAVFTTKIIAIGDDSVPPIDETCSGYLEQIETKIANGTITQEEIKEAQLRLSKDLYNLSLKEN
ncbi:PQQ-binding-like beta-propeller repeat protein [Bacillus sp. EAC]|uniref:outer membrane protein assembly factor BamB family protein n=1 Tax=Bacillus sp. EAC TaxID=1978338 RepID=UPI000B42F417|nr:PQQ-binding-like beta-propeller repeat protein [Bacillus sp. EAC]